MISVSAGFQTAIAAGTVKMGELYILELADGTIHRYTTHGQDIVWDAGDNVYSSIVPVQRNELGYRSSGEFDEVEVSIANIAGNLFDKVQLNILENALLTIKRIRWDQTYAADEEYILWLGTIDVRFNRKVLSISSRPYIDSLNILVPRHIFQEPCNHRLFDGGCGLSRAAFAYAGTATGGTRTTLVDATRDEVYRLNFSSSDSSNPIVIGDTVTGSIGGGTAVVINIVYLTAGTGTADTGTIWYVEQAGAQFVNNELLASGGNNVKANGVPVAGTEYYQQGELEMTGGDNAGLRRPILSDSGDTSTMMWPFPETIGAGDTYNLYPGCDQTTNVCLATFNNPDNFRGFPYIPRYEEAMV